MTQTEQYIRARLDEMFCRCSEPDEDGWRVTTHCIIHDPIERMMRGEHVNLVGIEPDR